MGAPARCDERDVTLGLLVGSAVMARRKLQAALRDTKGSGGIAESF